MKIKKEDLPVIMQAPGTVMRAGSDCGGITSGYRQAWQFYYTTIL